VHAALFRALLLPFQGTHSPSAPFLFPDGSCSVMIHGLFPPHLAPVNHYRAPISCLNKHMTFPIPFGTGQTELSFPWLLVMQSAPTYNGYVPVGSSYFLSYLHQAWFSIYHFLCSPPACCWFLAHFTFRL
jgi:hypothetical protein